MSNRRKYQGDDELRLKLLEVSEDPAYGLKKRAAPRPTIVETPRNGEAPIPRLNKTLH